MHNDKTSILKRIATMLLMLTMTVGMAVAQDARTWLSEGNAKYAEHEYADARILYEKAATAGSAEAQFNLGNMYYNGEGVNKDYSAAAMWFKRAARKRYAKAEYNLALCYMQGNGVPVSYDKALMYMKASALRGFTEAQKRLADLYHNGIMVEADEEESRRWLAMSRGEKVELAPEVERPTRLHSADSVKTATAPQQNATAPQQNAMANATATPTATPKAPATTPEPPATTPASTMTAALTAPTDTILAAPVDSDAIRKQNIMHLMQQQNTLLADASQGAPQTKEGDGMVHLDVPMAVLENKVGTTTRPTPPPATTSINSAPVIKILYPEDQSMFHTDIVKLKYQLLAQGLESVTKVTVMVDGVRQPETRAVKQANMIDVDVPNRDCTIMLFAQNQNGNSVPATIRLIRENVAQVDLPRLFAVAVGVGEYDDEKLPNLKMTTKDAQDFANAVMSKKGHPFSDVQVKLLCDQEARRSDIFEAMEWMAQEARPNDLCMFFFAGHGYRDEKDRFYFMPFGGSTDRLYECFSATDFKTAADDINSKFIIFADACYSAGLLEGNRSAAAQHFVEQLRRSKNGMMLYASSSGDTKSKEDPTWGNGAFTKALIEAFNGAARHEGDEGLSTRNLDAYLYDAVRRTTGFKQTPVFMNPSGIEHFNIFTYAQ